MRTTPDIPRALRAAFVGLLGTVAACGGLQLGSRPPQSSQGPERPGSAAGSPGTPSQPGSAAAEPAALNLVDFNRRIGLLSHGAPLPFTGSVTYLATETPDSTYVLVALTLPPSALVFRRESDQHRADYRVLLTVKRGDATVGRVEAVETVRVGSVREVTSVENSIIFQQIMSVAPGPYTLSVSVTDEASAKKGTAEVAVAAPRLAAGTVSKPVAFYEVSPRLARDSTPRIVTNPRATFTFGRDSTIDFYVEAYGVRFPGRIGVSVQAESATVWTDSVEMRQGNSDLATAIVRIPVARFAPGLAYVATWAPGSTDTVKTPFFVGYGEPVPPTTFAGMISYLRYFASDARLRALGSAPVQTRGMAWANFYRETDSNPATPENEALFAYLERLRYVDAQFAEGTTPGWRTDRGMVYLLFGQYDAAVDPFGSSADRSERGRSLQWEFRSLNLSVEFIRAAPFAQWRMTATSEQAVRSAARRLLGGDIQR